MRLSDFGPGKPGRLVQAAPDYWAFVPAPLAPKLSIGADIVCRLSRADHALGRLAGITQVLRNGHVLIGPFARREAVFSCRLEGLWTTLAEVFLAEENPHPPRPRPVEAAIEHAWAHEAARTLGRPSDADRRLLRGLHRRLVTDSDPGAGPGEFRTRQIWLGPPGCSRAEAVFVPPPVTEMHQALEALERYSKHPGDLPLLLNLALIHYQVDVIHPFALGTGAVNRLLLNLFLTDGPTLPGIPICMSAYFAARHDEYMRRLRAVCMRGEWEGWLRFFLEGVAEQADDTAKRVAALLSLREDYLHRLRRAHARQPLYRLLDRLFARPAITPEGAAEQLRIANEEAELHLASLVELGILTGAPGQRPGSAYVASGLVDALEGEPSSAAALAEALGTERWAPAMPPAVSRPAIATAPLPTVEGPDASWLRPLLDEASRRQIVDVLHDIEEWESGHREPVASTKPGSPAAPPAFRQLPEPAALGPH